MDKKKTILGDRLCDAWRPAEELAPWRWAERNVVVPLSAAGTKWSSEDARFVRRIMECFADEGINEIICMCSAQSAKTLTILVLMAWAIAEDPGPMLWVTSSEKEGKKLSKSRLMPLLERCAPVAAKLPQSRSHKTTLEIYFPGAPLIIVGCEAEAGLQSTPYRYVFCDEVRQYPKGALDMLSKRFRSYPHNYKKVIISTPDMEGDSLDRAYLSGSQERWYVTCPKCGDKHDLTWGNRDTVGGVKWDKNDETYDSESGEYRFDDLDKTVRYQCWNPECDHAWYDVTADRKYMSTHGEWVKHNANAPSNVVSFTWNALLPWWAGMKAQVREFLAAKKALQWADFSPLKDHTNETRGQVWTDNFVYEKDETYIMGRQVDYNPLEVWQPEVRRIMTVDVQGKGGRHFYFVIRAWAYGGWSRVLESGVVWSWEDLHRASADWHVDPDNVVIDTGAWAPECYKQIVASGYRWKAFKADDKDTFRIKGKSYIYSVTKADPAIGTAMQGKVRPISLVIWAKYGVLLRSYAFMHGDLGRWEIHKNVSNEYLKQVTSWDRRNRVHTDGSNSLQWFQKNARDDHYADCEQMQIVAASVTGLLSEPGSMPLFENGMFTGDPSEAQTSEEG